jgi:predicted transcriptional regulator
MSTSTIKSDLREIAKRLSPSASYADAMYELYVRMKIAKGKQAADEGRVIPHTSVKRRFKK